jgi:DNA-binding transcriptional MerR regulator
LDDVTEYRVDELAAEAGVSVEALRSYQSKGLLPAPRHEGRVAWYGDVHLARLRDILDLKHQGYSLRMIAHLLTDSAAPPVSPSVPVLADTFSARSTSAQAGCPTHGVPRPGACAPCPGKMTATATRDDPPALVRSTLSDPPVDSMVTQDLLTIRCDRVKIG